MFNIKILAPSPILKEGAVPQSRNQENVNFEPNDQCRFWNVGRTQTRKVKFKNM